MKNQEGKKSQEEEEEEEEEKKNKNKKNKKKTTTIITKVIDQVPSVQLVSVLLLSDCTSSA